MHRRTFISSATAAVAAGLLSGCWDIDTEDDTSSTTQTAVALRTFGSTGSSSAQVGTAFRVDSLASAGALSEQVVSTPGGAHRVFVDASLRTQAVRLADGSSVRISYPRDGRVDLVATAAGGAVLWGLAVYEDAGTLRIAPLGSSFTAAQINADLTGTLQGALTVSPDPSDLLIGIDSAQSRAFSTSLVTALMTGVATASALPAGSAGVLAGTAATQIGRGIAQSGILAATLMAAGYFLPAVVGGSAIASLLATVGSLMLIAAGAYYLYSGIANIVDGGARALSQDALDEAAASGASEQSLVQRIQRALQAMQDSGRALAERTLGVTKDVAGTSDTLPALAGLATLPAVSGALATVASRVRGALVDTTGRLFTGDGTLAVDGRLALALATSGGVNATVAATLAGNVLNGTYSINGASGSVSGTQSSVGQCNTSTNSGGSGTYSYSYNVGKTQGGFPFSYDMYSIPDQARIVDITGKELFNTGGLVSGSRSVTVPLQGEANVVVLVNAPTSGTAWTFTIGCAS